jgi:transposase-like protein
MTTPASSTWTPERIAEALKRHRGSVAAAARDLGCSRETVYTHLRKDAGLADARQAAQATGDAAADQPVTIRLARHQVDAVDALRGSTPRSEYLRDVVAQHVARTPF